MQYKLNNGREVEFKGLDERSRPILEYKTVSGHKVKLLIVDNVVHTQSNEKPDSPTSYEYQLRDYDFNFSTGEFVKKDRKQNNAI